MGGRPERKAETGMEKGESGRGIGENERESGSWRLRSLPVTWVDVDHDLFQQPRHSRIELCLLLSLADAE